MKSKKLISLEVSEDLLSALKEVAERDEITVSALIRLAIKNYLYNQTNVSKK